MEPRAVSPGHGWAWIIQGFRLFRQSPAVWISLVLLLYFSTNLLLRLPLLGVVFLLFMPVFIAGLMEGCRALENGEPLKPMHLLSAFSRNAAPLVTLGGVWLVGNLAIMLIVREFGGEAIVTLTKMMAQGAAVTPDQVTPEMQAAARTVARALLIGTLASLPLMMAIMYAPLLVYFHEQKPLAAMKASFMACVRNAVPLLVYGVAIFAGMFIAMPLSIALGQYDLAVWLLAPVVLPSIYASYKDLFLTGTAPAAPTGSVAG